MAMPIATTGGTSYSRKAKKRKIFATNENANSGEVLFVLPMNIFSIVMESIKPSVGGRKTELSHRNNVIQK
jgi:hypothetical protein